MNKDKLKMIFPIAQDEDGYPAVSSEGLWVKALADGKFEIDNVPFFVPNIAVGDIVSGRFDDAGILRYEGTVRISSNSTIRIVFFESAEKSRLLKAISELGCDYEILENDNLFALDVPASANAAAVLSLLRRAFDADELDYQESAMRYDIG